MLVGYGSLTLGTATLRAAEPATAGDLPMPVDEIIKQFVNKETEFARARENYTYRQTVKIFEYDELGGIRGKYHVVADIIFGAKGDRTERVTYAPVPTLKNIIMTPEDLEDIRSVQPFVMTNEDLPNYDVRYLGPQRVDEIETYVFSVKPKKMIKGERYFVGQIWVDQRDLQIVKTDGKAEGILRKKGDQQFPQFETYRDQVDGKYWFPVYTRADDTLHFKSGDQKIRMIIKYEDYKQFKSDVDIKFGGIIDETAAEQPKEPEPK
jgi:hypothetical protein